MSFPSIYKFWWIYIEIMFFFSWIYYIEIILRDCWYPENEISYSRTASSYTQLAIVISVSCVFYTISLVCKMVICHWHSKQW
jgi:hypothetical protein